MDYATSSLATFLAAVKFAQTHPSDSASESVYDAVKDLKTAIGDGQLPDLSAAYADIEKRHGYLVEQSTGE